MIDVGIFILLFVIFAVISKNVSDTWVSGWIGGICAVNIWYMIVYVMK